MAADMIAVHVAYAEPGRQLVLAISVAPGCTVAEAVAQSGILDRYPGIDRAACGYGIYGREVAADRVLAAGDRIEILRPLAEDPRQRRRRLARQGRSMGSRSARGG